MQRFSQLTLIPNLCVCVFIHWVVSNSLWPHALQHARFSCPSLSPGVAQIHVHWLSDAIQSFHPLLPPSPPALNHSQHQGLFQWVGSSHQVAKVLNLQFQHQSFHEYSGLISFRIDWFDLLAVQGLSWIFSNTTIRKHQFFSDQLSLWLNSHIHTWLLEKPELWLDRPLLAKQCLCFLIYCLDLSKLCFQGASVF